MRTYLLKRINSFRYAFKGIAILIATQPNAQIHILATLVITFVGLYIDLVIWEWCAILLCMGLVLVAEAVNTAIEFLTDLISPKIHPLAGKAKDVAAGAVLLAVIFCGVIWSLICVPKLLLLFE